MTRAGFTVLVVCGLSVLWTQTSCAVEDDFPTSTEPETTTEYADLSTQTSSPTTSVPKTKRPLAPEEQQLADMARQHIADVMKKNLIRLFTIIAATSEPGNTRTHAAARQFGLGEDDDGDDEDITFNPNTLPQVAQLLGAIFAGNLNLTSIVDRAFYLVPNTLRNQVSGVFSLLTGQPTTTLRPAPVPQYIPVVPITQATLPPTQPPTQPTTSTRQPDDVVASFVISSPGRTKSKYKIRRKIPKTTVQPVVVGSEEYEIISEGELQRLEQNLIESAMQYAVQQEKAKQAIEKVEQPTAPAPAAVEPVVVAPAPVPVPAAVPVPTRQQQPTDFMSQLRQVFSNTNMTEVMRVMPDLFNGARQAFTLLETLGQLDDIPILSDLFGNDEDDDDE